MRRIQAAIAFSLLVWMPLRADTQDVLDRIQGSRIVVLPFVNATGVNEFDRVTESISESIQLILQWSRQYDVRSMEPFDPFQPEGRTNMARTAREQRISAVIFGRLVEIPGGRIELESAVYGTEEGRILGGARKEAFGAFDLVEASDELVLTTSSALLGYDVELGAILFRPSRGDVTYRVLVDGIPVGDNIRALPQVLAGRRAVEVMLVNGDLPVYAENLLVRPGEALEVVFSLPAVTRREQDEIVLRQAVAARLLGDPSSYPWALEALAESGDLLDQTESPSFDPLRREQERLETAWQLDREYAQLDAAHFSRSAGAYNPGEPLSVLPLTQRLSRLSVSQESSVALRLRRNGYAQYHLTWLRWGESLAGARWEEAALILDDLQLLEDHYGIGGREHRNTVGVSFRTAQEEAETLGARRTRPWPYVTLGIGLGGIGFGTYMYATDEVSNYSGSDRDAAEIVQWGSIVGGGVISIASIVRIVQNNRAGETHLRDWARSEQGYLMDTAARVFSLSPGENADLLVLGPVGELITVENRIERLPALVSGQVGQPPVTGRASVVAEESTRLLTPGVTILTVE